ncbi:hypothetical protein RRH01S_04_02040 [Rhizobium rhizogenes NBRC 13257]|uniref:Uncharacterized protein n=1 Tax=Rhizobium rhizogenes NBRC 13257 TaxID=1220581 RepID=A0AA87U3I1_RHIRH|nr:hypothetical protein RRH01S_04_02040 [Rhizobium rhizogenes NBRC 13257]
MPECTANIVDENGFDLRVFHHRQVGYRESRFSCNGIGRLRVPSFDAFEHRFVNKHRAATQVTSAKAIAYGIERHRGSRADSQMAMFHEAGSSGDGASIRKGA